MVFRCGQVVRLREERQDVERGERGRVIGRYTNDRTLVVAFRRATVRVEPGKLETAA